MKLAREILNLLPKNELHFHLRGAMPIQVFSELLEKYSVNDILHNLPQWSHNTFNKYKNIRDFLSLHKWSAQNLPNLLSYQSLSQFLATYSFVGCFIRDISDLQKLIDGVIQNLKIQNIIYAEITISVVGYFERGITPEQLGQCLEEAAQTKGIKIHWIVDLYRDLGSDAAITLLNQIIKLNCPSIVGITLGGSEHLYPPTLFSEVYNNARKLGMKLTVHAGETLGPKSIWNAIKILGVDRIGHGVQAIWDDKLVRYLTENKIPLEICPTSNFMTGVVSRYDIHPVKRLYESGVAITISTDDPAFFDTTLTDEYMYLQDIGFEDKNILEIIKNGFRYAFLPEGERQIFIKLVEKQWDELRELHKNLAE